MERTIAFVDFDGTITMEDTLAGAMKRFVDPGEFALYSEKLARGDVTLSQVVRRAYDGAPSSLLPELLAYVRSVPLRPGFDEFLDTCEELDIPVVVISGGIRQFLEQKMSPCRDRLLGVQWVSGSSLLASTMKILWSRKALRGFFFLLIF